VLPGGINDINLANLANIKLHCVHFYTVLCQFFSDHFSFIQETLIMKSRVMRLRSQVGQCVRKPIAVIWLYGRSSLMA